jgi:hypothetical protein
MLISMLNTIKSGKTVILTPETMKLYQLNEDDLTELGNYHAFKWVRRGEDYELKVCEESDSGI